MDHNGLKQPEHQVAGHFATDAGAPGPLTDSSGHFFKPLQTGNDRAETELAFYSSLSSASIPAAIRRFFPSFSGTTAISGHDHLILSDLTFPLSRPSVIDFKIGARTWAPNHPKPYFEKCIEKDRETTSLALGFRISGLQIYRSGELAHKPARSEVKGFKKGDVRKALREFFGGDLRAVRGVLERLEELKGWFEVQGKWHFYSSSVLVVVEGEEVRVGMVDFAHVVDGDGVIDHNFLGGLCSLIRFVREVVEEVEVVVG